MRAGTASLEEMTMKIVLSPARVPMISGKFVVSMASAAALAQPLKVLMTMMFSAALMLRIVSRRILRNLSLTGASVERFWV